MAVVFVVTLVTLVTYFALSLYLLIAYFVPAMAAFTHE